ncbi:MAG: hypothetical protein HRT65_04650 [Flavobacteriaceae bacterium]|nr:hypothetical protein [Flavobacteriaceae bacterium]
MIRRKSVKLSCWSVVSLLLIYGGFHAWEYLSGNPYVEYLENHSETVPLGSGFDYGLLHEDLQSSRVIFVGEIHGFAEPNRFDVDFFKHLHQHYGVRHYLSELDFVQATYVNRFLDSGNRSYLDQAMKHWGVVQGRDNQSYFDKFLALQEFQSTLPVSEKFTVIGIDKIRDTLLLDRYLDEAFPMTDLNAPLQTSDNRIGQLDRLLLRDSTSSEQLTTLKHLRKNLVYLNEGRNREEILFHNFASFYDSLRLQKERVYGFLGLYHVMQYSINQTEPLAAKIRKSTMVPKRGLLSINFIMNESKMVLPSDQLPDMLQDDGPYTRFPISADNMLTTYIVGVRDLKRITPPRHLSLVKLNGTDSPFAQSTRLQRIIKLLPLSQDFTMTEKGRPYVQYAIFVRHSDWAEPMTPN